MEDAFMRKCSYLLADRHIRSLPAGVIVRNCPSHYGSEVTDDHLMFLWNALVDDYQQMEPNRLFEAYNRHVVLGHPIISSLLDNSSIRPELQLAIDTIVEELLDCQGIDKEGNR